MKLPSLLAFALAAAACGPLPALPDASETDASADARPAPATDGGSGETEASAPAPDGAASLTENERADLRFLREEEKLARDVYTALSGQVAMVFSNIASSEQRHMDSTLTLLERYGVADPAAGMAPGRFTDPTLQSLYDALSRRGATSALAALAVGAEIEELDIADIRRLRTRTTRADILAVYDLLELGSRNHLRTFYGRITASGGSYTPSHLDRASFDAIVSSPMERGGL